MIEQTRGSRQLTIFDTSHVRGTGPSKKSSRSVTFRQLACLLIKLSQVILWPKAADFSKVTVKNM